MVSYLDVTREVLLGLNEFELFNRLDHHTDLVRDRVKVRVKIRVRVGVRVRVSVGDRVRVGIRVRALKS